MARRRKKMLRCRATVHMRGDRPVVPGDEVVIDPTDPWMVAKIARGYLVPLESWEPPAAPEAPEPAPVLDTSYATVALSTEDAAPASSPASGGDEGVDQGQPLTEGT